MELCMFFPVVVFQHINIYLSQPEPLPSQLWYPMCFVAPKVCVITYYFVINH